MPLLATVKDENAIQSQKGVYVLGKDIREIPCLRSSFLLGITCGTFAGLISFLCTSKATVSCHIGFSSLWVVVFGYWIPCRYKNETKKLKILHETQNSLYAKLVEKKTQPLVEPQEEKKE